MRRLLTLVPARIAIRHVVLKVGFAAVLGVLVAVFEVRKARIVAFSADAGGRRGIFSIRTLVLACPAMIRASHQFGFATVLVLLVAIARGCWRANRNFTFAADAFRRGFRKFALHTFCPPKAAGRDSGLLAFAVRVAATGLAGGSVAYAFAFITATLVGRARLTFFAAGLGRTARNAGAAA